MMGRLLLCLVVSATIATGTKGYVDFLATADRSDESNSAKHFVVRITDPAIIAVARNEVDPAQDHVVQIVAGTIDKTSVTWNANWSFHLKPDSIVFGEMFMEVCDAAVDYVEENLADVGGAFLPNSFWCPWGSRILRELTAGEDGSSPSSPSAVASPIQAASSVLALLIGIVVALCL